MNPRTADYINTWMRRLSLIEDNDLGSLFDKYTALYTLYNRLYNDSFDQLKKENRLTKSRYSDFDKATTLVVEFITAQDIIEGLQSNNNFNDTNTIANLISADIFHINLADGVAQKDFDTQLMNNLKGEDDGIKAQAALSAIYNVRCNIQHGEKHFEEHQRLLLEPLISILQTIVNLQIEKLQST